MRLIIVDDNRYIAESLRRGLKSTYAVDVALNGQDGLRLAQENAYDVMLLDLNLPDMGGSEVCATLRQNGFTAPIIVLTGRDVLQDKISLLDMGADDYVTKPFSLEEVRARIRVALRHGTKQPVKAVLTFDGLALDPAGRTVTHNNERVELRRKEFDLLEYMMRNPGQTLSRPMILAHIWDMNENLWANVVDVHVKHLRDKIDRPFGTKLIKTVHGIGYKLDI